MKHFRPFGLKRARLLSLTGLASLLVLATGCKEQYLVGYFDPQAFAEECQWKHVKDERYRPETEALAALRQVDSFETTIFVGTWCNDSEKWVPRYLALADSLPVRAIKIISVDTTKRDQLGRTEALAVDSVPTFIFTREGSEIGRLVTKPPRQSVFHKRKLAPAVLAQVQ